MSDARLTAAAFEEIAHSDVPVISMLGATCEHLEDGEIRMRLPFKPELIRPGGTISGPAMMALADVAMYGLVLARIGMVKLAVTSSLTINFLRKPGQVDVIAEGRMIRCGRRLAYGEVFMYSDGDPDPVAHVTMTYAIPESGPA